MQQLLGTFTKFTEFAITTSFNNANLNFLWATSHGMVSTLHPRVFDFHMEELSLSM